jgi:excisionase family DNA binding protein
MSYARPDGYEPKHRRVGYSRQEFADALGVALVTVERMIARGDLPAVKVGGRRIITVSPEEFLASQAA